MTLSNLKDPVLRKLLAEEILVLRRSMKRAKVPWRSEFVSGAMIGLETAYRRIEEKGVTVNANAVLSPVEWARGDIRAGVHYPLMSCLRPRFH